MKNDLGIALFRWIAMISLNSIEGKNLALARGEHLLFRDLSFDVSAGEVLSVEGPNGAGKTSLLRLIAGFLEQRAGSIALHSGTGEVSTDAEERAKFVGWLGHLDGIKPQLSPTENLKFFARYYAHGDMEDALDRMGLRRIRDLPAQYLSAGQKKRVAFARLMLGGRKLWLLDEPLSSLDAGGRALAAELVTKHCSDGGMVVAATHEPLGVPCRHRQLGSA
jgi:heme exporter protein A